MKKLLLSIVVLLATAFTFAEETKKLEFNYIVETHSWVAQPVLTYKVGQLTNFLNLKGFDLNLVTFTGYDPNAEQGNAGAGFLYPLKIAQNGFLNLGGRLNFQAGKKPELAFVFGLTINL